MKSIVPTVIILLVSIIIQMGCAAFPKKQIPIVELNKLKDGTKKQTLSYTFSSSHELFKKTSDDKDIEKIFESEFVQTLIYSGYYVSVNDDADLKLHIQFLRTENPAAVIPACITGFSLFIIPSWATEKSTVIAKVTTREGKSFSYELSDSYLEVRWLPIIFIMPFHSIINESTDMRINIWKNLIFQMQKDCVIPGKSKDQNTTYVQLWILKKA